MMTVRKGIILAGGTGTRLYPLTRVANKQLLPIYDKPVIYYPLTTLMLAGIRDILIITHPKDLSVIQALLGDGSGLGIKISYDIQVEPVGLPEAFIIGEKFINNSPVALILGDNFYHGQGLSDQLHKATRVLNGATIFSYAVDDPWRFGIISLDKEGRPLAVEEKPTSPLSNLAITGLYYFDGDVVQRAKALKPSARGELEMTDLIRSYLVENRLTVEALGRGYVWIDVGTPHSLLDASNYVALIQSRQGVAIASPEEVAWRMEFINDDAFKGLVGALEDCQYRKFLEAILKS